MERLADVTAAAIAIRADQQGRRRDGTSREARRRRSPAASGAARSGFGGAASLAARFVCANPSAGFGVPEGVTFIFASAAKSLRDVSKGWKCSPSERGDVVEVQVCRMNRDQHAASLVGAVACRSPN